MRRLTPIVFAAACACSLLTTPDDVCHPTHNRNACTQDQIDAWEAQQDGGADAAGDAAGDAPPDAPPDAGDAGPDAGDAGPDAATDAGADAAGDAAADADAGCTPNCSGRQCGPDGCGGTCGPGCTSGTCNTNTGQCQATCTPACGGKQCGPNGCGGTCSPGCGTGQTCNTTTGTCCTPTCTSPRGPGDSCGTPDACGNACNCNANAGLACSSDGTCKTPQPLGGPCTANSDCQITLFCQTPAQGFPGGYCTTSCSTVNAPCGPNDVGVCIDLGDGLLCIKPNCGDDTACRTGYYCTVHQNQHDSFERQAACIPGCKTADCLSPNYCDHALRLEGEPSCISPGAQLIGLGGACTSASACAQTSGPVWCYPGIITPRCHKACQVVDLTNPCTGKACYPIEEGTDGVCQYRSGTGLPETTACMHSDECDDGLVCVDQDYDGTGQCWIACDLSRTNSKGQPGVNQVSGVDCPDGKTCTEVFWPFGVCLGAGGGGTKGDFDTCAQSSECASGMCVTGDGVYGANPPFCASKPTQAGACQDPLTSSKAGTFHIEGAGVPDEPSMCLKGCTTTGEAQDCPPGFFCDVRGGRTPRCFTGCRKGSGAAAGCGATQVCDLIDRQCENAGAVVGVGADCAEGQCVQPTSPKTAFCSSLDTAPTRCHEDCDTGQVSFCDAPAATPRARPCLSINQGTYGVCQASSTSGLGPGATGCTRHEDCQRGLVCVPVNGPKTCVEACDPVSSPTPGTKSGGGTCSPCNLLTGYTRLGSCPAQTTGCPAGNPANQEICNGCDDDDDGTTDELLSSTTATSVTGGPVFSLAGLPDRFALASSLQDAWGIYFDVEGAPQSLWLPDRDEQNDPTLASRYIALASTAGTYFAVWRNASDGIRWNRFGAAGSPLVEPSPKMVDGTGPLVGPDPRSFTAAGKPAGDVMWAWVAGSSPHVYAFFMNAGADMPSSYVEVTNPMYGGSEPDAADAGPWWVVALRDSNASGINLVVFDQIGNVKASAPMTGTSIDKPQVAYDGSHVGLVWRDNPTTRGIWFKYFTLNSTTGQIQSQGTAISLSIQASDIDLAGANPGFVLAYSTGGSPSRVKLQRLDANGTLKGAPFDTETGAVSAYSPQVVWNTRTFGVAYDFSSIATFRRKCLPP